MAVDYRGFGSAPQLVAKVTADVGNIPTVTSTAVDFTVPGSQPGMFFVIAAPDLTAGLAISGGAFCGTAGTVTVRFVNPTGLDINPASQAFYFIGL